MKLTLTTTGGLAAGIRRQALELDSAHLSPGEAERLARLVEAATREAPPPASRRPDEMGYRIEVGEGSGNRVLRASDSAKGDAFAALLDFVTTAATRAPRPPK